ncbi:hypothetical protein AGOR_G00007950 [Albula goreensis]|uniref:Uncharacterized protein n=1 Tax=Albula goreensis TaxID=1534307 RepID=A0A8T3EBJ4_9TELE|nr:hypothetical protein AGOR_G00007950 [Albula goreensis]
MKAGLQSTIGAGTSLRSPVLSPPKPTAIYCNQQVCQEISPQTGWRCPLPPIMWDPSYSPTFSWRPFPVFK